MRVGNTQSLRDYREGHTKRIQKERDLLRGGVGEVAY